MIRFLFPTVLIALSFALYALYTKPLYQDLQGKLAKEVEVQAALLEADKAQEQLDEIERRYKSFPPDADRKLGQLLPEKIDPIKLLIDSSEFLERNGFSSRSVSIASDQSGDTGALKKHSVSFSISASYDTFREFLHVLESSLMLRDLKNVGFSVDTSEVENVGVRPEFAVHTYNVQVTGYSLQ